MLVRMSMEGIVDFSEANPFDPRWHAKLNIFLREYIDTCENRLAILEANRLQTQIILSVLARDANSLSKLSRKERAVIQEIVSRTLGLKFEKSKEEESAAREARDAWIRAFGDLSEPETQAKIDAVAAGLAKLREQ